MDTQQRGPDPVWRLVGAGIVVLLALLWVGTTPSLSGWTAGIVTNSTNSAATGSIAATHTYGPTTCAAGPRVSTQSCADSLLPTASPGANAPVSASSTIRNDGTLPAARTTQEVSAASCGTVQLANARNSNANPMLPRYGVDFRSDGPFNGTDAVTLDGTGYAVAVASKSQATAADKIYGVGVWFKAARGQSGPLLELGSNATNVGGSDTRSIYLRQDGRLGYATSSTLSNLTSFAYNDGAWHFAYARFRNQGTNYQVNLSIDSTPNSVNNAGSRAGVSESGYWHLGWAPSALTGLTTSYFTGSLSNMVVFNNPDAPAIPTSAQLDNQAAFSAWAASATEHWLLGDTGTTTYTGSQPTIGTTSPCSMLTVSWAFSNPTATAVASTPLSTFATDTPYAVSDDAEPGATQRSTITVSRGTGYNPYIAGLRLYVPLTYRVQTTNARWPLAFTWASADSVVFG